MKLTKNKASERKIMVADNIATNKAYVLKYRNAKTLELRTIGDDYNHSHPTDMSQNFTFRGRTKD